MGKAELGEKQVCPNCGSKFYDLTKRPAVCPKCSFAFDPSDEQIKLKRAKTTRQPVYASDDEEEVEDKRVAAADEEGFEEETEEAAELDSEPADDSPELTDEEDEDPAARSTGGDALPAGFSESDEADIDEAAPEEDDGVPLLEDDEEFTPEEELGDVDEGEEDEGGR